MAQNTAKNLWEMGKVLADAQERLSSSNGTFVRWVKQGAGLSVGTAYRLINVYHAFDVSKLETSTFAPSALYLLSEPSTPATARTEALHRAERGETITHARAQEIVALHRPAPPLPDLPPMPPAPPSPEYTRFEREELLPRLHDAGVPDAPQMLSGQQEAMRVVPEERKEQARLSLRASIVEAMRDVDTEDEEALDACADEVLGILGKGHSSIAISSRIGAALAQGPRTLSDLTAITAWVCGECIESIDRTGYLNLRKRTMRLIDSMSYQNGLPVFEHALSNDQITYSLIPDHPDCP